jgi:protein-arginine deiminase
MSFSCAPDGGGLGEDEGTEDGTDAGDDGTSGGEESGETGDPAEWWFGDVFGVANLDDDDASGVADWYEFPSVEDDDRATFIIRQEMIDAAPAGARVRFTLTGAVDQVRMWDGSSPVLGQDIEADLVEWETELGTVERAFELEFADYLAEATMTVALIDGGSEIASDDVRLLASPLILHHHLQPAEHVFVSDVGGNAAFVGGYSSALGSNFSAIPGSSIGFDVWMQDEIQFGVSTAPDKRLDTVVDSIRDRGLDAFPELYLEGPGVAVNTWGPPGAETTYDSFGNLEVAPPVTVDGVEYPFGRIYWGSNGGSEALHGDLANFLTSQRVQAPFTLDTSWLCIGHVDEFSTFVPDPGSEKGFKLVLASVTEGYQLLETLDPSYSIPQYGSDHGYSTVGAILNDGSLRSYNEDLQVQELDLIREQFKTALGLEESDIIDLPALFERHSWCRTATGSAGSLIPGAVNLVVSDFGEGAKIFAADPFFRSGSDQGSDPVIADFIARMPAGVEVHFLDDWNTYHLALGEVHCGTNVSRTPVTSWWDNALHLLEP